MRLRQILHCNNRPSCLTPSPSRAEPLKAQLASELSAAASDEEKASVRAEFEARERILEHEIDFTPRELSMALQGTLAPAVSCALDLFSHSLPPPTVNYNFLSK